MKNPKYHFNYCCIIALLSAVLACKPSIDHPLANGKDPKDNSIFYIGADLSYINEMEDCGATYRNGQGTPKEVYTIFEEEGCNLARFRLWHNPTWTNYSNLADVKQGIARAKKANMKVLLDFHYSDSWADPGHQEIPAAWLANINDTAALGQQMYDYTYATLKELNTYGLLPDMVQIGNETNGNILVQGNTFPINWGRNAFLLNKGISAVRQLSKELNKKIEIMLHIAQPENGLWWFKEAAQNGVSDFDWIALSYYPQYSTYTLQNIQIALEELIKSYNKKLMIVETAYPFTLANADGANNLLGTSGLLAGYPATQQGQLSFLTALNTKVKAAGGMGVVYWEPAWVSTPCSTRWSTGSHWDNATLFDNSGIPTKGMEFYKQKF